MALFHLKYGDGSIPVNIPDTNVAGYFELPEEAPTGEQEHFPDPAVPEVMLEDKTVGLLVPDGTRQVPLEIPLVSLAPYLQRARKLLVFVCTGTHRPMAYPNQKRLDQLNHILQATYPERWEIILHDAQKGPFVDLGTTRTGTPIKVNKRLVQADSFIVIADVKPHYFAGYSNVLKYFVPGLTALSTAEANHSLALHPSARAGQHPWHPDTRRRNNPLAEDMLEAYFRIVQKRPVWVLGLVTAGERVVWAKWGDPQPVMQEAFQRVDRWMSFTVSPAPALIVSCGGYPHDESLYTAQRALELTRSAVVQAGQVLFIAECRHGIGPPVAVKNFYQPLTRSLKECMQIIQKKYVMYAHKAYKLAHMIQRLSFLGIKSRLPDPMVKQMHLTPVAAVQKVVDDWIQKNPNIKILVVNDANKIFLHT